MRGERHHPNGCYAPDLMLAKCLSYVCVVHAQHTFTYENILGGTSSIRMRLLHIYFVGIYAAILYTSSHA